MESKFKVYWKLFTSTFMLSAFTFGGGFVIVPLMKKKFVDELKWIEESEILDLVAIAQSSPGAVAVNAAIIMGRKIAGFKGSLIAMIGTVLPPFIILSIISFFYIAFKENLVVQAVLKGMQAGIAAIIVNVALSMGGKLFTEKKFFSAALMIAVFCAIFFFKVNVAYIVLFCILLGTILYFYRKRKGGKSL